MQQPRATIAGFRRIQPEPQAKPAQNKHAFEKPKLNVVLLQLDPNEENRSKLKQCQQWLRKQQQVRLWKVTKSEAFYPIYLDMMKQSLPAYFVSICPLEELQEEPLGKAYKILLERGEGSPEEVHRAAKDNIERIRFILLRANIQELHKINYFHAGVALLTSQPSLAIGLLQREIGRLIQSDSLESTSSINTQELHMLTQQMEGKIGEGVKIPSPGKGSHDPDSKAWMALNSTPGVGTYFLGEEKSSKGAQFPTTNHNLKSGNNNPGPGSYQIS